MILNTIVFQAHNGTPLTKLSGESNNTNTTCKYGTVRFYSIHLILNNVIRVLSKTISSHVLFFAFKYYYNNYKPFE